MKSTQLKLKLLLGNIGGSGSGGDLDKKDANVVFGKRFLLGLLLLWTLILILVLMLYAGGAMSDEIGGLRNMMRHPPPPQAPLPTQNSRSGCDLPHLDPFDPIILKHVNLSTDPIDCTSEYGRPVLFSTDFRSSLVRLDYPGKYGLRDCCFRVFTANGGHFHGRLSERCYPIEDKHNVTLISPEHEYILVYCHHNSGSAGQLQVVDAFNFVHENSERVKKAAGSEGSSPRLNDQLNVVVFGLDSVSHSNFIRSMPRSYAYIRDNQLFGFNGYTKVGDNTYPNVWPMLTGLSLDEAEAASGCWGGNPEKYVDDCPFIWKNFSQAGFATSFAEDAIAVSIFNQDSRPEFQNQPTDYYFHPFANRLENQLSHFFTGMSNVCYGPRTGFKILLDNVVKLGLTFSRSRGSPAAAVHRRYFSFTWATSIFHSALWSSAPGDLDVLNFLEFFGNAPQKEETILILLSDHGRRGGDILTTVQGRIQERLPFAYFQFPDWFQTKYSTAVHNMRTNSERLVTAFDIYETISDLLDPEQYITNEALQHSHRHRKLEDRPESLPRGISLFTPVPLSRTCADAAIDPQWCVCHAMDDIPNPGEDPLVANATQFILSWLNGRLANHTQCAPLALASIISAQVFHGSLNETNIKKLAFSKLTTTFQVVPSDAMFEATVIQEEATGGQWEMAGDLSRLNLYGNQSRCVDEHKLKKYCYCS